jgi:hypothetical protein
MESYSTEIWSNGKVVLAIDNLPDMILGLADRTIVEWYRQLAVSSKWAAFCKNFDEGRFKCASIPHAGYILRVIKRNENDDV